MPQPPGPRCRPATDHPMHFFDLPGDTIWGATAAMLSQLLRILLGVTGEVDGAPLA